MVLPRLKELKMYCQAGNMLYQEHTIFFQMCIEDLLTNLPPLNKLELVGDYKYALEDCLGHHSTLKSLTLHEKDDVLDVEYVTGIDSKLLEGILRCENLTFLDIQVHRSRGDGGI